MREISSPASTRGLSCPWPRGVRGENYPVRGERGRFGRSRTAAAAHARTALTSPACPACNATYGGRDAPAATRGVARFASAFGLRAGKGGSHGKFEYESG